jgi:hypothetical protein
MKLLYVGFLLLAGIVLSSCNLINPDEKQPAYISIDTITVTTDVVYQGSNSAKISEAWIYVDDNLLGVYDLPCKVPVLADEGNHKLTIGAGIQLNGISSTLAPYAFYQLKDTSLNLSPGFISTLNPNISYYDSLTFPLIANFDLLSGNKLSATSYSDTSASLTTDPTKVFEGTGSFLANLKRDSGFVEFETIDSYSLPKQGRSVFAEVNYKNTHVLSVGIAAYYTSSSTLRYTVINLNPSQTWKKVYINLTNYVSSEVNANNYRLFFYSEKTAGSSELEILIDNLKIVY